MLAQYYPVAHHGYNFELNKDFQFAAAHFIPTPAAGACMNIHGHTYFVNVTVAGNELNEEGFLVNFKMLKDLVHKRYDHQLLNALAEYTEDYEEPSKYPTTEIVAETIWRRIQLHLKRLDNKPKCIQVIVRETPTSYVIFRPTFDQLNGVS